MVGTHGHDAVLYLCDIVTSQDQPANMVELVLRSVCQLRRQSTSRCGRIPAVEFFDRSSLRIADFERWQLEPEYFLTSIVGHRGLQTLSRRSSITSYRNVIRTHLHAALIRLHLRRMFTPHVSQLQSLQRRSLMRRARSTKKRPRLLAELESRYKDSS